MNILMINGSPRKNGNTARALAEMEQIFLGEGFRVETVQIGTDPIRGCIACASCKKTGKCVFDDMVNEIAPKLRACDGLVIGSPVYYASANGSLISLLDRLFYSNNADLTMKVGTAIAVARRGGTTATFDELNKYFTIYGMPIASGQYWNSLHGMAIGEAEGDEEGLQNMRTVARNMSFLLKSIVLGKETFGFPEKEKRISTSFIR